MIASELMQAEDDKAKAALPAAIVSYIESVRRCEHGESYLIAVLHKVQEHFGYLDMQHMNAVSQLMQIPSAKVTGVASFYHFFTFVPRGKHKLAICLGTACFVKGSGRVLEKIKELLHCDVGNTTTDRMFSLDVARCVGACALAPVMIVDEKVYAGVKPDDVARILGEYGFVAKK